MPIEPYSTPEMVQFHKNIFFLLNTCSRMCGEFIEEVNSAMHEVVPEFKKNAERYPEQLIRFCRMDYNIRAKWEWNGGIDLLNFSWRDAATQPGTALGDAYHLLNSALTRRDGGFLHNHANQAPIIILLLAGTPIDDVGSGLSVLRKNNWFQASIKIAIEVDDNSFHQYLLDFTMDEDAIIHVDGTNLRKMLKDIMIRSVMSAHKWGPPKNILGEIIGKPLNFTDFIDPEESNKNYSTDDMWDDLFF